MSAKDVSSAPRASASNSTAVEGPGDAGGSESGIQVLDRLMRTLDLLQSTGPLGPSDLARRLEMKKSTMLRLLAGLREHGLVQQETSTHVYRLGARLVELGQAAQGGLEPSRRAEPYLRELVRETGETTHLCVPCEQKLLYAAECEGTAVLHLPSMLGRRVELHSTSAGKVLLANLPTAAMQALLTTQTAEEVEVLVKQCQQIAARGWAVEHDEYEHDLSSVAAPVRNHTGHLIGALTVSGSSNRIRASEQDLVARLRHAADALSAELGYPCDPPQPR